MTYACLHAALAHVVMRARVQTDDSIVDHLRIMRARARAVIILDVFLRRYARILLSYPY